MTRPSVHRENTTPISADHHDLIVYRKIADGQWIIANTTTPDTLELTSIGVSVTFADIFANVVYVEPPPERAG